MSLVSKKINYIIAGAFLFFCLSLPPPPICSNKNKVLRILPEGDHYFQCETDDDKVRNKNRNGISKKPFAQYLRSELPVTARSGWPGSTSVAARHSTTCGRGTSARAWMRELVDRPAPHVQQSARWRKQVAHFRILCGILQPGVTYKKTQTLIEIPTGDINSRSCVLLLLPPVNRLKGENINMFFFLLHHTWPAKSETQNRSQTDLKIDRAESGLEPDNN